MLPDEIRIGSIIRHDRQTIFIESRSQILVLQNNFVNPLMTIAIPIRASRSNVRQALVCWAPIVGFTCGFPLISTERIIAALVLSLQQSNLLLFVQTQSIIYLQIS